MIFRFFFSQFEGERNLFSDVYRATNPVCLITSKPITMQCFVYFQVIFWALFCLLSGDILDTVLFTFRWYFGHCFDYFQVIFWSLFCLLSGDILGIVLFTFRWYFGHCFVYFQVIFWTLFCLLSGDILVFMPGQEDIEVTCDLLRGINPGNILLKYSCKTDSYTIISDLNAS